MLTCSGHVSPLLVDPEQTILLLGFTSRMPVFWKKDRSPVLHVHVPKAGGSSFSSGLVDDGWRELYSIRGMHAHALDFARCSPQHWHAEILEMMFKFDRFERIIVILRDPFERFMSEYRWQRHQGMTALLPAEWTSFVMDSYQQDPFVFDNHIRPQSDFMVTGASRYQLEARGVERALAACLGRRQEAAAACAADPEAEALPHLKKTDDSPALREQFEPLRSCIVDFYERDYALLDSL